MIAHHEPTGNVLAAGEALAAASSLKKSPIERILPETLQTAAASFYGFYGETLKGSVTLATRLKWWMQEESLTVAEAKEAMRRLMTPERSAEIDTAPKAIAALSAEVVIILRDRRAKDATAKRSNAANEKLPTDEAKKLEALRQKAAEHFKT